MNSVVVQKSYKFRLYPNNEQQILINKNFGCCRFIYNSMLAERLQAYEKFKDDRESLWEYKYKTEKDYKNEFEWLREAESTSLQQARIDLSKAYMNFFKSVSGKNKSKSGFPKFHKKGYKDSYRIMCNNFSIKLNFDLHKIKIPKLGWVKYRDDRTFDASKISSKSSLAAQQVKDPVLSPQRLRYDTPGTSARLSLGQKKSKPYHDL